LEYTIVKEFLIDLKKEFGKEYNKIIKVAELQKIEQENRTMEKFIQEFRRAARESEYKERLLIEKFKRRMNRVIQRKLIETEKPSRSLNQ